LLVVGNQVVVGNAPLEVEKELGIEPLAVLREVEFDGLSYFASVVETTYLADGSSRTREVKLGCVFTQTTT